MRDIGSFYLYEIVFSPIQGGGAPFVRSLSARCNHCKHTFLAAGPPLVSSIGNGGAAVECPNCGERQAVAGAFFQALVVATENIAERSQIHPQPSHPMSMRWGRRTG